ncbi:hypothetical protein ACFL3W_02040 [Pseudomonadota bacterium]
MFKQGNTLAQDGSIRMMPTEFRFFRRYMGWSKRTAANQFGVTVREVETFETKGPIPEYIEQVVKRYA